MSELELVSKEFAQAVWDNTRTKDILAQDNPKLCERMARSLGTMPRFENTPAAGARYLGVQRSSIAAAAARRSSARLSPILAEVANPRRITPNSSASMPGSLVLDSSPAC